MVTDRQVKHVPISTSHLVTRMIYSLISTKQVAKMEGDQGSANNISFVTKLTTARHLGYSRKQIFCAKKVYVILMDQVSDNLTGYSGSLDS